MKLIVLLFPLFPVLFFTQNKIQAVKNRGEVFKHHPEHPYEDIKRTGIIVVKKGIYGLVFEDKYLSLEVRKKVQSFFNHRYYGYTDLKTYELHVEATPKGWKIEGYIVP